jgi:hypothetical protein
VSRARGLIEVVATVQRAGSADRDEAVDPRGSTCEDTPRGTGLSLDFPDVVGHVDGFAHCGGRARIGTVSIGRSGELQLPHCDAHHRALKSSPGEVSQSLDSNVGSCLAGSHGDQRG